MDEHEFAEYVKERYEQDPNGSMDRFGKEFIQSGDFTIRVVTEDDDLTWGESVLGTSFGSTVERMETTWEKLKQGKMELDDLREKVRTRVGRHPRYIDFYDKDNNRVVTGVAVRLTRDGYAIYPDPDEYVDLD